MSDAFAAGEFPIHREGFGRDLVNGFVSDDFGIDLREYSVRGDAGVGWVVTHIPTGGTLGLILDSREEAEFVVEQCVALAPTKNFWHDKRRWQFGVAPNERSATCLQMRAIGEIVRNNLRVRQQWRLTDSEVVQAQ